MKNIYRDSLHQLVKPILVHPPKDEKARKEVSSRLKVAARQEEIWAQSAYSEGSSEKARALKLPKKDPMRLELLADVAIANDFGKIREKRAENLLKLADRMKK